MYQFQVHFDATEPNNCGCHFVFPTTTLNEALEIQRTWFGNYQGENVTIVTSIQPYTPKVPA